ncbi:MAG: four helix bundle protein [Spirochaetales bacterium]|nr:four helix bundle protein [Spirochaetales bacterium]
MSEIQITEDEKARKIQENTDYNLPVYSKWADFTKEALEMIKRFPVEEKYVFSAECRKHLFAIGPLILAANEEFDIQAKKNAADKACAYARTVRADFKLALAFGYISFERMQRICIKFIELGKMIGGWKRSFKPEGYYKG